MDPTENVRREMVDKINSFKRTKEELQRIYGEVYNTSELNEQFDVIGFMAPFITVRRFLDNVKGTLMFQDQPRYYFSFKEV